MHLRNANVNSRFVYLRPTRLVYFRETGPYATSVLAAWKRLNGWMGKRGIVAPDGMFYGLARDNPAKVPTENCRYDACIELPLGLDGPALTEIQVQRLPAGAYIRHKYVGRYSGIGAAALPICNDWVPNRGLRLAAERPLVVIYMSNPSQRDVNGLKAEICAPVATGQQSGDRTAA